MLYNASNPIIYKLRKGEDGCTLQHFIVQSSPVLKLIQNSQKCFLRIFYHGKLLASGSNL